jgi:hypothetical protein
VPLADAFAELRNAFPKVAEYRGKHFQYAERNGIVLIERRKSLDMPEGRAEMFCYWLLVEGIFQPVHVSHASKLAPMRTIGSSFTPSVYDH